MDTLIHRGVWITFSLRVDNFLFVVVSLMMRDDADKVVVGVLAFVVVAASLLLLMGMVS